MNSVEQDELAYSCDVAIIGMAGRFPGSKNINAYWQTLKEGIERISFFSDDELEVENMSAEDLGNPNFVKARAILEDIDLFDASFFNISARSAQWMDPQQRLFLECAWSALEDAGYDVSAYKGAISVYAGTSLNTYILSRLPYLASMEDAMDAFQLAISNDKDHLATRVSYKLNLRGESLTVQTACSTSLVAVHLACQSLLSGQCDMALAGGVSIQVPQKTGYLYQDGMISSPDGHCRAFDDKARGTVRGNGLGIVVLKLLSEAIKDGDHIHAVIKGSAINNDGNLKVGYTAPSIEGQSSVIAKALAIAGIEADTINYVEAHGTGTPVGDPIEVEALTRAYRQRTDRKQYCALGAVKTNIGHLDAAAGVAGLIKASLALKHKHIPPTLHFERGNSAIDFANSPFYVANKLTEWEAGSAPRRAAVSSFGIGGTNAHAILEEAPQRSESGKSRPWQILTLSAKSVQALNDKTAHLASHLEQNPQINLADAIYTCNAGRQQFAYRRFVVARDRAEIIEGLNKFAQASQQSTKPVMRESRLAFLFPGQGAQTINMAKSLYESEPEFRKHVDSCARILKETFSADLLGLLYPTEQKAAEAALKLAQPENTLPALFAIEYALAQLWISFGAQPFAMIGHSYGEYVAACLAGVFSVEDGLKLAVARGRLMQRLDAGAMVAIRLSHAETEEFLNNDLALAAINSERSTVVSGPVAEIEKLEARLAERQVGYRRLDVPFAYHSAMIEPIIADFTALLSKMKFEAPKLPYISSMTGNWIQANEATDPAYWANQMRRTVRFGDGIETLIKAKCDLFLEVGPGQTLCALVKQRSGRGKDFQIVASFDTASAASSGGAGIMKAFGQIWQAGAVIDWPSFYRNEKRQRVALPTYPFERQRYWIETRGLQNSFMPAGKLEADQYAAGKIDAHPAMTAGDDSAVRHDVERARMSEAFIGPRDEIESKLATIWGDVLGLKGIGIHDSFFDLGGDSLMATQVYARVKQSVAPAASLQDVLAHQTIAEFAEVARAQSSSEQAAETRSPSPIQPVSRASELPMSFSQQRLWFVHQSAPQSPVHNLGNAIRMTGDLNVAALERSLAEIVRRHESLRTRFANNEGRLVQIVEPSIEITLPLHDLTAEPEAEREQRVLQLASDEAQRPFALERAPLMRASLIKLADKEHVALFCMHHIVCDAWSFGVLVREIAALYEAYSNERPSPLPELPIQYADYAAWQRQHLQGEALDAQLGYWKRKLGGQLSRIRLPFDRPRPETQTFRGANQPFAFEPRLTEALNALARREGVTLYTLLLAAFNVLLNRYSNQDDIIVGSPIAGRNSVETEGLIGLFLNTIALRSDCSGDPPFDRFLKDVRETALNAFANQDLPFEKIVEAVQPERSLDHNPIFQVFFNFQNTPMRPLEIEGLSLARMDFDNRAVGFDLILNIVEDDARLTGAVQYSTDLFDASTIKRVIGHLERLLESITASPDARLSRLEIFTDAEKQRQSNEEAAIEASNRASLKRARRRSIEISSEDNLALVS